eukprot:CAMPEP_0184384416 /NCGR_PEP_ID=MMETSP0007-20130409/7880_1 /TAXON_ID=97485 /ORGANISM="Prymnesium parvum, Strain Texoma1" /LENGTH=77 /DNA_ID=CAMNT_0026731265 /DNA_START=48 /DNA_END=278 /DNA_ORIENTATION=+
MTSRDVSQTPDISVSLPRTYLDSDFTEVPKMPKMPKVSQTTLFQGFLKRKTADTTGEMLAEAATVRKEQEARQLQAL